uniref:Uncharacterized protein n=1 Tax=Guillardia theta TaxID=55529 RepID=A0A7S4PK66_GUITH
MSGATKSSFEEGNLGDDLRRITRRVAKGGKDTKQLVLDMVLSNKALDNGEYPVDVSYRSFKQQVDDMLTETSTSGKGRRGEKRILGMDRSTFLKAGMGLFAAFLVDKAIHRYQEVKQHDSEVKSKLLDHRKKWISGRLREQMNQRRAEALQNLGETRGPNIVSNVGTAVRTAGGIILTVATGTVQAISLTISIATFCVKGVQTAASTSVEAFRLVASFVHSAIEVSTPVAQVAIEQGAKIAQPAIERATPYVEEAVEKSITLVEDLQQQVVSHQGEIENLLQPVVKPTLSVAESGIKTISSQMSLATESVQPLVSQSQKVAVDISNQGSRAMNELNSNLRPTVDLLTEYSRPLVPVFEVLKGFVLGTFFLTASVVSTLSQDGMEGLKAQTMSGMSDMVHQAAEAGAQVGRAALDAGIDAAGESKPRLS